MPLRATVGQIALKTVRLLRYDLVKLVFWLPKAACVACLLSRARARACI